MGNMTQAKNLLSYTPIKENAVILSAVLTLTKYRIIQAGLLTDVGENRR